MTASLATKQGLRELEARSEARFEQVDTRLVELEKRMEVRFNEQAVRLRLEASGCVWYPPPRGLDVTARGPFARGGKR